MAKMCFSLVFGILFALHVGSMHAAPEPAPLVDGEILFDSSLENTIADTTEVKMPESCAGKSYCFEKGPDYPEEAIANLFNNIKNLKMENDGPQSSMENRNGDSKDLQDCPDDYTKEPIYYITDTNDKVRVVVQLKDKFEQIYTVRWCLTPGPITEDTPHFLKNTTLQKFNIECVDTTMPFDFIVLRDYVDPKTGEYSPIMEIANAKGGIPVCCKCRYDQK